MLTLGAPCIFTAGKNMKKIESCLYLLADPTPYLTHLAARNKWHQRVEFLFLIIISNLNVWTLLFGNISILLSVCDKPTTINAIPITSNPVPCKNKLIIVIVTCLFMRCQNYCRFCSLLVLSLTAAGTNIMHTLLQSNLSEEIVSQNVTCFVTFLVLIDFGT